MPGFLSEFEKEQGLLKEAFAVLGEGFAHLPDRGWPRQLEDEPLRNRCREVLMQVANRMQDNYPYFHDQYCGQMLKPPHSIAKVAYALAMAINPNNHALDGGRASSAMEKEAVAEIAAMFGLPSHLGHLTASGTIANLEALWVWRDMSRKHKGTEKTLLVSEMAHYTHTRMAGVIGVEAETMPVNPYGQLDLEALEARLEQGGVGCVVATFGTTGLGALDAIDGLAALKERYGFWLHVDAAYGGYFVLSPYLNEHASPLIESIAKADSIVIDPHKHGLQPYGCGCVLFADPEVGAVYKHDSPYTYFSSDQLHLGEITLECSRAGASAVALWATQKLLPLQKQGYMSQSIEACLQAAQAMARAIKKSNYLQLAVEPQLDIVCFWVQGVNAALVNEATEAMFKALEQKGIFVAMIKLDRDFVVQNHSELLGDFWKDETQLYCLRCCLMKENHLDQIDLLFEKIEAQAKLTITR